jgi:HEPN domain-containing protein
MSDEASTWLQYARENLQVAQMTLEAGLLNPCLQNAQQAVEKALKALIVERTGELPPRIHNLPRLAEAVELGVDEKRMDFLAALTVFYIQTRYPEGMELLATATTRRKAEATLRKTEKTVQWLLSMLK